MPTFDIDPAAHCATLIVTVMTVAWAVETIRSRGPTELAIAGRSKVKANAKLAPVRRIVTAAVVYDAAMLHWACVRRSVISITIMPRVMTLHRAVVLMLPDNTVDLPVYAAIHLPIHLAINATLLTSVCLTVGLTIILPGILTVVLLPLRLAVRLSIVLMSVSLAV